MNLLIDTQIFLWYVTADRKLPARYRAAIIDSVNTVYLSLATTWETAIKFALGNLPLPQPPSIYVPRLRHAHGMILLPIDELTFSYLEILPQLHRDPFDRLLIAQALRFDYTLVTVDREVQAYAVKILP